MRRFAPRLPLALALAACSPDLSLPPGGGASPPLLVEPFPAGGATSRAARFGSSPSETLRLFADVLTSRQLANVRRGEPGQTLLAAEVMLHEVTPRPSPEDSGVTSVGETSWWVPTSLLEAGRDYTILSSSRELTFATLPDELVLERVWPSTPVAAASVFCLQVRGFSPLGNPGASAPPLIEFGGMSLGARSATGDAGPGDADSWTELPHSPPCWFAQGTSGTLFTLRDAVLQPTVQGPADEARPERPECSPTELALDWGCMHALDDRVLIRGGETATFWIAAGETRAWFVLAPGTTGVVRGLAPERENTLHFTVHFPLSAPLHQTVVVRTQAPRSHVVINEVLADPVTAEPAQEWVELYNDGSSPVDLAGWRLEDEGGSVTLPSVSIAPSGYALLVNDTYVENLQGDAVPEPNVLLVRLPLLAKSGLSNTGETLRLWDKWDMVVSTYPSTPKPTPGVSIARGVPWQVDGDSETFGRHASPGASPGAANERLRGDVE